MPRTRFSRDSIFAARCGKGGRTFEFRFTGEIYPIPFINSRFVFGQRAFAGAFSGFIWNCSVLFQCANGQSTGG
jgi:hypothetical protein